MSLQVETLTGPWFSSPARCIESEAMVARMPYTAIDEAATAAAEQIQDDRESNAQSEGRLRDRFGRAITDLRVSVTDRCNYKCVYCRTGNEGALYGDLPFSDYLRMARVLVGMGITKVRLTGGEPLLRNGVVEFVRQLSKLQSPSGT